MGPAAELSAGDGIQIELAAVSALPMAQPGASEERPSRPFLSLWRKVLLTFLGLGVVGSIVGGSLQGTRSSFTATTVNPSNTFAAGTLKMTNSANAACTDVVASACGALSLSLNTGMTPGSIATGTVTITNSGTLPATMTLSLQNLAQTSALASVLNLTVHDDTGAGYCVYGLTSTSPAGGAGACDPLVALASQAAADAFANVTTITLPAFTGGTFSTTAHWAPGEQHHYTVTVELTTGATQVNSNATLDFVWNSVE